MADLSRFGLDVGTYGPLATPDSVLGLAHLAEDAGFDSIWLADHVAFPVSYASEYPYSAKGDFPTQLSDPLLETIATMGVLVGATKRIRIGTAVLIVPYRNPVLTARMLVTLDQLSGGRIELGAGVGWLEEEFAVLDTVDFKRRGKATDEYLAIFKAICAGGEVTFTGETYAFAPIHAVPGSLQQPHPPILIGGIADLALARVARLGNGWLAVAANPTMLGERLAALKRLMQAKGRRFEELSLNYKMFLDIGAAQRGRFDEREPGTGTPDEIIDDIQRIFALGFQRIIVRQRGRTAGEVTRQIERFITQIAPKV